MIGWVVNNVTLKTHGLTRGSHITDGVFMRFLVRFLGMHGRAHMRADRVRLNRLTTMGL